LGDRARYDAEGAEADLAQAQAGADQAASDFDQVMSDADQDRADRDQHASDRDQVAADWEHSHSSPAVAAGRSHKASRVERDSASRERDSTAQERSQNTARRLTTAAQRDELAEARDRAATARDRTIEALDEAADAGDRAAETRERLAIEAGDEDSIAPLRALRIAGASIRRQAAEGRSTAAADRQAAAIDRQQAAADRRYAGLDELTGMFRRGTGELALTHEIDRWRRSGQPLVLAVIDVDALKAVNDTHGHAAGDMLLRNVATAIISTMRTYDATVRWGGDEFVCALSNVTLEVASVRIEEIKRVLDAQQPGASISAGLAELYADDTLESLIERADAALYLDKTKRAA
jgi:diguanylate cyclase (GGDEF)-like protein